MTTQDDVLDTEEVKPVKQGLQLKSTYQPIEVIRRKSQKDYSLSSFTSEIMLKNESVQRLFERSYEEIQYAFHRFSVADRFVLDSELSQKYNQRIETVLGNLEAQLLNTNEEIDKAFEDNNIMNEKERIPEASCARVYHPHYSSPYSKRFLEIFKKLDRTFLMIDGAWINQIIDANGYRKTVQQWIHIVRSAISDLHRIQQEYQREAFPNPNSQEQGKKEEKR